MRVKVINKRPASVLQKKRVCAYARVSTDSRRQEDSLENQMETYERLITGNPEYEFIGVFADQGISGYCENRPQFQRMMEKARAKQKSGECIRLQTFDFLGFTFYCGRSRKGMPYIMPKTSSKKFRQKIRDIKVWLYANRDQPLKKLMGMLNLKLTGHYRYYGISFNGRMISNYKQQVRELLFKVLNRRSDRKSYTREGFIEMLKYYPLALPKIYVSLF